MTFLFALVLALVAIPAQAASVEVAHGCDVPRASNGGRMFFVDPARGAKENDGSEARPWRTLGEVLDPANHLVATRSYGRRTSEGAFPTEPVNPAGRVRPGDTLVLMSGDHGAVDVMRYVDQDFISVVAGSRQTPLIRSLRVVSSSHWLFRGIKFQGQRPEKDLYAPMVGVGMNDYFGPTDNIVFADDSFSTEDRTEGWSPSDWVNKPYKTGFVSYARCTALVGNHFFNLRDAVGIGPPAEYSLVQDNLIEDFGNDGIDTTASNVVIRGNRIRSSRHSPAEPLHPDGIQGWTAPGATNRNVVIDSNWVVNLNPAEDNAMQGISIFDGLWDGLTVTNNLVVTNNWHGIALYGIRNAVVANNTVVPARPARFPTWLMIHDPKQGAPSQNVIVRNNIAAQILANGQDLKVDHNIASTKIEIKVGERKLVATKGGVAEHNIVDPFIFSQFVDFDMRLGHLDLRPGPRSPAAGAGEGDAAPALDIEGRRRVEPIDIGAFAR